MVIQLLSILGSSASLISLVFVFHPSGQPFTVTEGALLGTGIVLTLVAVVAQANQYLASLPKRYKSKKEIRDYMYRWIENGGRVCIFSNDLSWVEDEEMVGLLKNKAKCNELQICIPTMIPIAQTLMECGATVITYAPLKVIPQSRFTIANCGRMDAQVAVGRRLDGSHVIEEFGAGDHPVFSVASDLVDIVTRYCQTRRIT